ncbi:ABC transporter ATP-binding protein [Scandinavium manionii]|uniref:ABC transporter ATP-binding protein n=1 Tax=Scandinavium manionii TaxID=2926520 RepID=UPI0021665A2B|nr:oligopeptide/dipeptide ABC transporter ATP-binding protein [Scandinavium manionii]MCS2147925.1 ATP-binding cassette domain-containing protein [Scandinavium manionii]MCS2166373.1 ATP-binding cassette domain-containing protein [Scandinavium manionii]
MSEILTTPSLPLLRVEGLCQYFKTPDGRTVHAVESLTFDIKRGSTVGLVGESGSGKTTAGRAILRLLEPTSGKVFFDDTDVLALPPKAMKRYRQKMQIIFQDPFSSLNPRMKVAQIIAEALNTCGFPTGEARKKRIEALLIQVGLQPEHADRYPHEFSGGQRQRIGIARAIAVEPDFIVADESVSALDVSVQAQVLNLLGELQESLGLTLLFIAHDLSVVEYLCDEVIVMYLGRVMERGPCREVYSRPRHPYTQALLSAAPIPDPTKKKQRIVLKGDIPSPISPPSGCVFRTRCPSATDACAQNIPQEQQVNDEHWVSCVRLHELNHQG